jgi:prevent-host-death family protein
MTASLPDPAPEPGDLPVENEVGIRELRHDFRAFLDRVQRGERFVITDRGRPVARLAPHVQHESVLDRLIREGRATPASRSPADFRVPTGPISTAGTDALQEQREERFP